MGLWDNITTKEKTKGGLFSSIQVDKSIIPPTKSPVITQDIQTAFKTSTPVTTDKGTLDFLKGAGQAYKSFYNPKNTGVDNPVNVVDVTKEVPKALSTTVGQPSLRAYAGVSEIITGKPFVPEGEFQKELYGTDKPISLMSIGRETRGADPTKESKGIFRYVDPSIGLVIGTLDAVDGGILSKLAGALRIGRNTKQVIAASKDTVEIVNALKREIPTLTDNLANAIAKPLVAIDNVNDVDRVINRTKYQLQERFKPTADPEIVYDDLEFYQEPTINLDEPSLPKVEKPKTVGTIKLGDKEITLTKDGKLELPTPGNVSKSQIPVRTGDSVAQDLKKMGSDGGVSDFLLDTVRKENYSTQKVKVADLIENDLSLKEYIDSTKGKIRRYKSSDVSLPPIVTSKGEVWDGYNRIAQAIKNGETEIEVLKGVALDTPSQPKVPVYEGETDLTTKILKDLEGKSTVSKQYISDATNRGELKQAERDIIRQALENEGDVVNVSDFAKKVKTELLPLNRRLPESGGKRQITRYENIALPEDLRGNVKNYSEVLYESPVKTSAGDVHFGGSSDSYFGHTRIEDMADDVTRRVIEVQSDLYQKGNLENEFDRAGRIDQSMSNKELSVENAESTLKRLREDLQKFKDGKRGSQLSDDSFFFDSESDFTTRIDKWEKLLEEAKSGKVDARKAELSKLRQYNDPTAHFRMVREEIKKAAQDGKTRLLFPTGETAMKIEGLGDQNRWMNVEDGIRSGVDLKVDDLKVGKEITMEDMDELGQGDKWIITDVLGDGKFKAMPKSRYELKTSEFMNEKELAEMKDAYSETFDISGKVDTSNPIYKFYEKEMQRYLNKFGGKKTVDDKGVSWIEVPIRKEFATAPVEAFGLAAGLEEDENGNITFDPLKAGIGMFALSARGKINVNLIKRISEEKLPGPITDDLSKAFTNISRRTLEAFSKRFAKLKGTDSIQGLLTQLADMDDAIKESVSTRTYVKGLLPEEKAIAQKSGSLATKSSQKIETGNIDVLPGSQQSPSKVTIPAQMTKQESSLYLDNLARSIKNPEESAVAKYEYDKLWEKVNGRAVVDFEQLSVERGLLEEMLSKHPAKQIIKAFPGKALRDIDVAESAGKRLDSKIAELGYADFDEAQQGLEEYVSAKERLLQVKQEIRDLRPQVETARLLSGFLDDLPVVDDIKVVNDIDTLTTHSKVRDSYKDISGFQKETLDPPRIFKQFFGPNSEEYKTIKQTILNPFDDSKGAMVDEINSLGKQLEDNVVKKYNIVRGSKEAQRVREYGEGIKTQQDLINEFGPERAQEIIGADAWFRKTYDSLLDKANEVLARIYPNNPDKLVPKHSNYYRHLRDSNSLSDSLAAIKNLFDTPAGIDPQLAGQSEFTKPLSRFVSFAKRRTGEKSDTDAIEGFIDYIMSYSYLNNISPNISKFRYLRRKLAEVAPVPGDPKITGIGKEGGINNMLVFLDNYANKLAGKSHPLDRWITDTMPGGRGAMQAIQMINNRVKANQILLNAGSAVSQLANVPIGVSKFKQYSIPGIQRSIGSIFTENVPMKESNFLKEREMKSLLEQFKVDWTQHPIQRTTEEAKSFASWVLKAADQIGTHFIWNSAYEKAVRTGIDDPIRYADNETRALVAGRGIGEVPLGQESKIFQLIAPFQLEVGNMWWVMKDMMREKDFGAVALLLVSSWLYNEVSEEVKGNRVVYDPINALVDGVQTLQNEDDKIRGTIKLIGRQVGEILSNVPFGQTIAGQIPDQTVEQMTSFMRGGSMKKEELFGQGDPGRFGSGLLVWKALEDPVFRLLTPFGGNQAKKTLEGVQAFIKGEVDDKKGKLNFKLDRNVPNLVKAVLFGKNSTEESNKFFETREELFQTLDRQQRQRNETAIVAEEKWAEMKELDPENAKQMLLTIAQEDENLAQKILEVSKDEKAGLTSIDRMMKQLGVENGERAKFIYEKMKDMDSSEVKKQYLLDLAVKKVITKDVLKQILEMKKE